jgi:hypothetical protein
MKHKILGKTYNIVFVKKIGSKKDYGECCYSEKRIKIDKSLKGLELLDTIIHESLHGGFEILSEETVNEFAEDLSKLLWELGYRKVDLEEK